MKKYLLLLLLILTASLNIEAQTTLANNVKITGNTTDNNATKVVVQSANNVLNTISKTDLQDAFYFATASALPVTGITDKLYVTRDDNKLYRFNGTVYSPIGSNITGLNTDNLPKWDGTKLIDSGFKVNSSGNVILPTNVNDFAIFLMKDDVPTGSMLFQAGGGSASFGGGLRMFGSNSTLNAGGVSIGLASGALRKFSINDTGLSNGSDVFTVFSNGTTLVNTTTDNTQGKLQVNGNITASAATLSNQVPTFGQVNTALALKANLASPAFTGTPTAPTATAGTNTTQIATTAFVLQNTQSIPQLESNTSDLTVWNNGKGDVSTNTSFGDSSLKSNTTGQGNTSYGQNSLSLVATSNNNTSYGRAALQNNTAGNNTAIGNQSLASITTGASNTALGNSAGLLIGNNSANTTSGTSVFLGDNTRPLNNGEVNQIVIGQGAIGAGSNTVTLGNASITQTILRGTVSAGNGTALNHLITKAQTLYTNQTISANKTVVVGDFVNNNELILSVDASDGNKTVTLDTFTNLRGYKVTVKKMDSSANSVLIQGVGGINIDGASTLVVSGQYSKVTVGANLSQYIIL